MRVDRDWPFGRRRREAALLVTDRVEDRSELCGEAFRVIAETRATVEHERWRTGAFSGADERGGKSVDPDLAHPASVSIAASLACHVARASSEAVRLARLALLRE